MQEAVQGQSVTIELNDPLFANAVVYIKCPFAICEQRDANGLYKKARNKEVQHITVLTINTKNFNSQILILETDIMTVDEYLDKMVAYFVD